MAKANSVQYPIAGSWLWTRLLSIIFPPCKRCSKLQATGNVYITYSNEKRMITRSHITDPDGNIFLFQLLSKDTTDLCHLKMSPAVALHISSCIVHDHVAHRFHRSPSPNAQATVGQDILLNFKAGLFRTAA